MNLYLSILMVLGLATVSMAQTDSEQLCVVQSKSIERKLNCIRGMTFKEVKNPTSAQVRVFDIQFVQPIDHFSPARGSFSQRVVLLHRDEAQPMVLQTSGYMIFGIEKTELMSVFETNQLQIEHRYFANSRPSPVNWSNLTVPQSAMDFHRITLAFKKIYKARWVNTGASKGGMTSTYHRRFFPNDVDGTLADVAPISFAKEDPRYIQFVENVGGAKFRACRNALKAVQISLLKNANVIVPKITGSFSQLGGKDVAFEHAVSELPFSFWQYSDPNDPEVGCQKIPANGDLTQQYTFLSKVNEINNYSDESFDKFMPYYFQVATQLGGPASDRSYLAGLVKFPFTVDQYLPKGVPHAYTNAMMLDMNAWVQTKSDRMLYIYGELDPWTAGSQTFRQESTQRYRFMVPGGNHGATFMALPPNEKAAAITILSRWLNKRPVGLNARGQGRTLEQIEAQYRKHFKL